ncbi:MAG: hypothetical protein JNL90_03640 [Planctomycetes bacterium]|nr:hypothetical protein [Planctomycetota bacterium]
MATASAALAAASVLVALVAACGEERAPAPAAATAPTPSSGEGRAAAPELAPLEAARAGDFAAAAAAAWHGSPLQRELLAAATEPPAWLARLRAVDFAALERLPFDPLLELLLLPGAAGREGECVVVALRREAATEPWRAAAIATLPSATLFGGLAPIEGEFAASTTRRLVLLLDGLLRTAFTEPGGDLAEFVSADAAPFGERPAWPRFLCGLARSGAPSGAPITASIATFAVRAQSRAALLAAARIERLADGAPTQGSECLVLYRPLSPRISGTAWGVAWVMEVGESSGE